MVLTHSKKKKIKKENKIVYKDPEPSRMFMSKSEVMMKNAVQRETAKKMGEAKSRIEKEVVIEAYEKEIETMKKRIADCKDETAKRGFEKQLGQLEEELDKANANKLAEHNLGDPGISDVPEEADEPDDESGSISHIKSQLKGLENQYNSTKGPGSKAKKEEIAAEIQKLEAQLPVDQQF